MPHRKTASYLNQLRTDLQDILTEIGQAGEQVDATCHDLSKILPHDVRTDSAQVKVKFDAVLDSYDEFRKQLKAFRIARNKYLEFF